MLYIFYGMNRQVFFLWIFFIGVVLLTIIGVNLKQKNKRLIEKNSILMLQNDSIISANLQFEKDLADLQETLDSVHNQLPNESDRVSSKPF